jgi:hypothetical protein
MNPLLVSGAIISLIAIASLGFAVYGSFKIIDQHLDEHWQKLKTRIILIITGWISLTGALAWSGSLATLNLPPRPMLIMLTALTGIIIFSYSRGGRKILKYTPFHWLIFFQVFRIAVEFWFWQGYRSGVLPQIMSFEGNNHDIYAGLLAIVAGFMVMKLPATRKPVLVMYNLTGFLLLANTLRTAALSFPSGIQKYPFDEGFLLLGQLPFVYLPAILVPLALGIHILSLRQLFIKRYNPFEASMA